MAIKQEASTRSSPKTTGGKENKTMERNKAEESMGVSLTKEKTAGFIQPKLEPSSMFFVQPSEQALTTASDQRKCFGLIETRGFLPLVIAADAMLKAANINLIRYERVMAELVAICVVGDISAVRIAVDSGIASAQNYGEVVASAVLSNPIPAVMEVLYHGYVNIKKEDLAPDWHSAIGIIETQGFVCAIVALDAMLKAANVNFSGLENTGAGSVVPIITGDLSAVRYAIEAGAEAAGRVGQVIATQVLARPQVTKEAVLPLSAANLSKLIPPPPAQPSLPHP
ncbi:MAG: BMC domain-containing protein [Candidatus Tectomicrobia bacterium]|uniref:BMC domain-containing protein n=1 Tax=Tectimicrobiota bacterium TaxID=2528274 RepID=A0A933LPD8_UNCTE|nr:BMC domain-containing protein [Candidatus Tectomicrobia bacterium]